MDFFKSISTKYDQIWRNIIQPQRQVYSKQDLGPIHRPVKQKNIIRRDFEILNSREETLECSFFSEQGSEKEKPVVIYLHGNAGSRMQALTTLHYLLPEINLLCFDFAGSGKSGGEYVTMGLNQSEDLQSICSYAKNSLQSTCIGLWGRSMGAVTAIYYASLHPQQVSCLILDSPFTQLSQVIKEIAVSRSSIPGFIIKSVISMIKKKINEVIGKDIFAIDMRKQINLIQCHVHFIYANQDTIIAPAHTQNLYKLYNGPKSIYKFDGNHNSLRPKDYFEDINRILKKMLIDRKPKEDSQKGQNGPSEMRTNNFGSNYNNNNNRTNKHRVASSNQDNRRDDQENNREFMDSKERFPQSTRNNHSNNQNNYYRPEQTSNDSRTPESRFLPEYQTQKNPISNNHSQSVQQNYDDIPVSDSKNDFSSAFKRDIKRDRSNRTERRIFDDANNYKAPDMIRGRVMSGISLVNDGPPERDDSDLEIETSQVQGRLKSSKSKRVVLDNMDNVIDQCIYALTTTSQQDLKNFSSASTETNGQQKKNFFFQNNLTTQASDFKSKVGLKQLENRYQLGNGNNDPKVNKCENLADIYLQFLQQKSFFNQQAPQNNQRRTSNYEPNNVTPISIPQQIVQDHIRIKKTKELINQLEILDRGQDTLVRDRSLSRNRTPQPFPQNNENRMISRAQNQIHREGGTYSMQNLPLNGQKMRLNGLEFEEHDENEFRNQRIKYQNSIQENILDDSLGNIQKELIKKYNGKSKQKSVNDECEVIGNGNQQFRQIQAQLYEKTAGLIEKYTTANGDRRIDTMAKENQSLSSDINQQQISEQMDQLLSQVIKDEEISENLNKEIEKKHLKEINQIYSKHLDNLQKFQSYQLENKSMPDIASMQGFQRKVSTNIENNQVQKKSGEQRNEKQNLGTQVSHQQSDYTSSNYYSQNSISSNNIDKYFSNKSVLQDHNNNQPGNSHNFSVSSSISESFMKLKPLQNNSVMGYSTNNNIENSNNKNFSLQSETKFEHTRFFETKNDPVQDIVIPHLHDSKPRNYETPKGQDYQLTQFNIAPPSRNGMRSDECSINSSNSINSNAFGFDESLQQPSQKRIFKQEYSKNDSRLDFTKDSINRTIESTTSLPKPNNNFAREASKPKFQILKEQINDCLQTETITQTIEVPKDQVLNYQQYGYLNVQAPKQGNDHYPTFRNPSNPLIENMPFLNQYTDGRSNVEKVKEQPTYIREELNTRSTQKDLKFYKQNTMDLYSNYNQGNCETNFNSQNQDIPNHNGNQIQGYHTVASITQNYNKPTSDNPSYLNDRYNAYDSLNSLNRHNHTNSDNNHSEKLDYQDQYDIKLNSYLNQNYSTKLNDYQVIQRRPLGQIGNNISTEANIPASTMEPESRMHTNYFNL